MTMRRVLLIGVLVLTVGFVGSSAQAETIAFNGNTVFSGGGTFSFAPGGGNSLTVTNALISNLLTTFGACIGGCGVTGGLLNLTSGGQSGAPIPGQLWTFASGGKLSITGGIASLGIAPGSSLLTAMFTDGATFLFSGGTTSTFHGNLILASIVLNPLIGTFNFIGGTDDQIQMNVNLSGGVFGGEVQSSNVALQTTVPEPASLLLLGAGLIFAAVILRRKLEREQESVT